MPFISIELFEGRTKEQKRALAKALTQAVQDSIGAPAESVHVFIRDLSKEHYAQAGVLRSDLEAQKK